MFGSDLLNATQLANALGVSVSTVYKFRKAGLPYYVIGSGRKYYKLADFENWCDQPQYKHDDKAA